MEKAKARQAVQRAVQRGDIVRPDCCERCGKQCSPVAHHHHGYDEVHVLDVQWLCRGCHNTVHCAVGRSDEQKRYIAAAMLEGQRRMPAEALHARALHAWKTKRARGYQAPSVSAASGKSQNEMSQRGWDNRRQTFTPEEISAQCARGGAAPRTKIVKFTPVRCVDCNREYSGSWITRHKREGHCVQSSIQTCVECGASFISQNGSVKRTCSRLCTNRAAVKVREARRRMHELEDK